jgi:pimeloyl-ACP methyl ester carboxylesterase
MEHFNKERRNMMTKHPNVMPGSLVEQFCTPPLLPDTDFDRKAVADAEILEFDFEGQRLAGYAWGAGKQVLLLHGWGSRASHLSPLGKMLVRSGFRVIAFDAPGHGKSLKPEEPQKSSMFEYCRALWTVAQNIQPLHALVGHSLGAMSAIFTAAGHAGLSDYRVTPERLVSISAPANLNQVLALFCQQHGLGNGAESELAHGLEQAFEFSVAEYSVTEALKQVKAHILLVHDENDDDVPVASAHQLHQARTDARLVLTQGAGHQRILANRSMIRAVKDFLSS